MKAEKTRIICGEAELSCEVKMPDKLPAPAVLICHGMNVQGYHGLKLYSKFAEAACEAGFVALLFDFRGVGSSTGRFDYGLAERYDFMCALNFLASRPEVLKNRIGVVGHSLGGAVSLYMLQNETRVRSLVLWAVPKNHNYNVKKFIRRTRGKLGLFLFEILSPLDSVVSVSGIFKLQVYGISLRLKEVRGKLMKLNETEAISKLDDLPVLVVVGSSDKIVGEDEAREVFSSAPGPKNLLIVDSANHIFSGKEDELVRETIEWMKKWL